MNVRTLKTIGDICTVLSFACSFGARAAESRMLQTEVHQAAAFEVAHQLHDVTYAEQVESLRQKAILQLEQQRQRKPVI